MAQDIKAGDLIRLKDNEYLHDARTPEEAEVFRPGQEYRVTAVVEGDAYFPVWVDIQGEGWPFADREVEVVA